MCGVIGKGGSVRLRFTVVTESRVEGLDTNKGGLVYRRNAGAVQKRTYLIFCFG